MPEPLEFLIVQNLQTALRAIAVADGYHYDVAAVAVKLDPNQDVEQLLGAAAVRPFLVIELTPDDWGYEPSKLIKLGLPFVVHAVQDSDVTDDDSFLQTHFRLCADVEQAAAVDISRGGLATDTRIESREFQPLGGSQVWSMVKGRISTRRSYGAPNG